MWVPAVPEGAGSSLWADARSRGFYTAVPPGRSNALRRPVGSQAISGNITRQRSKNLLCYTELFHICGTKRKRSGAVKSQACQPSEIKSRLPPTSSSVFADYLFPAFPLRSAVRAQTSSSPWANWRVNKVCGHLAGAQRQRKVHGAPTARKRSSLPCPAQPPAGEALGTLPCPEPRAVWGNNSFSAGRNHQKYFIYRKRECKHANHTSIRRSCSCLF